MPKFLVRVEFNVEMELPALDSTEDDIQEIFNECEYHFHYNDKRVKSSLEEMVDVGVINTKWR